MTKTKYQVLARRYRPQTFLEVVGQEPTVTTLKNALRFDKAAHAYLFCGSRGVGKTTLARLFAKAVNCAELSPEMEPCNRCPSCLEITAGQSLDVIEIDGASNRGIDDIRQINETALYSPSSGRYKIYIIDEVHMLTKEAFNALLKTLEEPPEKAKFFFATTEPHKVLPTIISRCQRFDLGRIQLSQIITKLEEIASDLGRGAEPEALHLIASFSDGSLRDAESLFDQILCFAEGNITAEVIRSALGLISQEHFFALDLAFSESRLPFAFELVEILFNAGKDLSHFYSGLIEHVRNLLSARLLGEKGLTLPPELATRYLQSSRLYIPSQCLYLLDYLLRQEPQIQKSACQRVAIESALLHYIQSKNRIPIEVLVRRLTEMEEVLKTQSSPSKIFQPPLPATPAPEPTPIPIQTSVQEPPIPAPAPQPLTAIPTSPPTSSLEPTPIPIQTALPEAPIPAPATQPLTAIPTSVPEAPIPAPATQPLTAIPTSVPEAPIPAPASIPNLKVVPFNPFKQKPAEPVAPTPPAPQPIAQPKPKPKPESKREPAPILVKPEPFLTKAILPEQAAPPPAHRSHYDTLMRFAAAELEGILKIN